MPKVSIIVPVYNSEKYLSRCIDSILSQTYTDFECLLIDDGSSDKSPEICDNYAKKDSRIKVFHQSNQGAAAARNDGICRSSGEYLMFCDSDDYVSPFWIERLMNFAQKSVLPMGAYCGNQNELGEKKELNAETEKLFPASSYFFFNQCSIAGYLCNAAYHRETLLANHIYIRENKSQGDYNEDLLFALTYTSKMNSIVYTGYADYLYDTRDDSLSRSSMKFYFEKYAEKFRLWLDFIEKNTGGNKEKEIKSLATSHIYHFLRAMQNAVINNNKKRFKEIVESSEMQKCVQSADSSNENPVVIKYIKAGQVNKLWIYLRLAYIKERIG